jgi:hypothetical protein
MLEAFINVLRQAQHDKSGKFYFHILNVSLSLSKTIVKDASTGSA